MDKQASPIDVYRAALDAAVEEFRVLVREVEQKQLRLRRLRHAIVVLSADVGASVPADINKFVDQRLVLTKGTRRRFLAGARALESRKAAAAVDPQVGVSPK